MWLHLVEPWSTGIDVREKKITMAKTEKRPQDAGKTMPFINQGKRSQKNYPSSTLILDFQPPEKFGKEFCRLSYWNFGIIYCSPSKIRQSTLASMVSILYSITWNKSSLIMCLREQLDVKPQEKIINVFCHSH